MHTDAQRHQLYEELADVLSPPSRDVLMDLLPPVGWSDVARQSDIALVRGDMAELRGEVAELRGDMAELGAELKTEMGELRVELKTEMGELRVELKGEMSELRSHVDAQLPKLIAANIASMIGVASLVLVAAQLG